MPNKLIQVHPQDDDAMHKNSDVPTAKGVNQAAVLIPLVHHEQQWQVLFIRRALNKWDRHSGQVAFPGGRLEQSDSSHEAAALRETQEEIGVDPSLVNVLGTIDPYITVSDYVVTPVVGVIDWPTTLNLQSSEVARAFLIPFYWLKARQNFTFRMRDEMDTLSAQRHPVIVYEKFDDEILWGATARMTLNFIKAVDDGKIPLPAASS